MGSRAFKRPESVLVLVHTADRQVLLLRRVDPPGFWQSITGSLRWDESAPAAARRELFEETGIDEQPSACGCQRRFPIYHAWRHRYPPGTHWNTEHWFELRLEQPSGVRLSAHEHTEFLWLAADQALALVTSWTNREAIEYCLGGTISVTATDS